MAQIRISTAEEVLRENPFIFIKQICNDQLNIEVCAKLLKNMINQYEDMIEKQSCFYEDYKDIYDYISCQYLGAYASQKDKTVLVYSAVLRSFMKEEKLYYMGAEQTGRCLVKIYKAKNKEIYYEDFQEFIEKIDKEVIIQKKVFVNNQELRLEFICDNPYYIGLANQFAKDNGCEHKISII